MLKTFIALFLIVSVPLTALATEKDAERLKRLEAGEVIVQAKQKKNGPAVVRVMGLMKAPMPKLWELIQDCNKYDKTMLRIRESKELSRKGNKVRCRTVLAMPFPVQDLAAVTEATHVVKPGKEYSRSWKLIEGDYKVNEGSWTLKPYKDGRTLVIYKAAALPKIDVPDMIRNAAQKKSLPELFEHIRKQVE